MAAETLNHPAGDTLPDEGGPGAQHGAWADTGSPVAAAPVGRAWVDWMWQPARTLPTAHLALGSATTVAQNGRSGEEFTGYAVPELRHPPQKVRPVERRLEHFTPLVKWIGRVLRVEHDAFVALVEDQTARRPSEEVEFERSEITPADEPLLRPGAVFYWTIGYRDRLGGPRTRESVIRFRRLPPPTEEEWTEADAWAEQILALARGD